MKQIFLKIWSWMQESLYSFCVVFILVLCLGSFLRATVLVTPHLFIGARHCCRPMCCWWLLMWSWSSALLVFLPVSLGLLHPGLWSVGWYSLLVIPPPDLHSQADYSCCCFQSHRGEVATGSWGSGTGAYCWDALGWSCYRWLVGRITVGRWTWSMPCWQGTWSQDHCLHCWSGWMC